MPTVTPTTAPFFTAVHTSTFVSVGTSHSPRKVPVLSTLPSSSSLRSRSPFLLKLTSSTLASRASSHVMPSELPGPEGPLAVRSAGLSRCALLAVLEAGACVGGLDEQPSVVERESRQSRAAGVRRMVDGCRGERWREGAVFKVSAGCVAPRHASAVARAGQACVCAADCQRLMARSSGGSDAYPSRKAISVSERRESER